VFVPALLIRDQVAFLTVMGHMMPKLQKETAFWKLPRPCILGNPFHLNYDDQVSYHFKTCLGTHFSFVSMWVLNLSWDY